MHGYGRFAALADHPGDDAGGSDSDGASDGVLHYDSEFSYGEYEGVLSAPGIEEAPIEDNFDINQPVTSRVTDSESEPSELKDEDFTPDIICEQCQALFPAEGYDQQGPRTLRVDATNPSGCRLCEALINAWGPESLDKSHLDLNYWFAPREGYFMGVLDVIFSPVDKFSRPRWTARFGFQRFKGTNPGDPKMPRFTIDIPSSTRLEHSGEQINKWLRACEAHPRCSKRLPGESFIPSRLIEISRDNAGTTSIRLRSRSHLRHAVKYVALSHCWGSFMPAKLVDAKLEEFGNGIPWNEISPVFRDAINVSTALDIWYIWIDSLCIIQDSKEDWKIESAVMCDVYSHCHLNIAADTSQDGSRGLFRERNPALLRPIHIVVKSNPELAPEIPADPRIPIKRNFSAMDPGNYLLVDIHCWKDEVEDAPLGKRGWVLQERALSPRTIHFGLTQVAWECWSLVCNEVFQDGFLEGTIQKWPKNFVIKAKDGSENDVGPELGLPRLKHMSSAVFKWHSVVTAYTQCKLSYGSDKLVAVAGLAEMIGKVMRSEYFAGLWRTDLEHQLLWKVIDPFPAAPDDGTRGPSWSWASVDGAVEWDPWLPFTYIDDSNDIKWLSHIESAQVTRVNDNPFGQVSSGELVITGPLKVLHLRDKKLEAQTESHVLEDRPYSMDIFLDTKPSIDEQLSNIPPRNMSVQQYTAYPATSSTQQQSPGGRDVFLLPLRIMHYDYCNWDWEAPMLSGLLLLPCVEAPGTYRRVGQLTVSGQLERDAFKEGKWPFQRKTKILGSRFYHSIWSNGDCTICVV